MYPVLFEVAGIEITSFGVMVALAGLVGLWLFHRELRRSGLRETALDAAVAGVFGGLAGAKLLWMLEHLGMARWRDLLFSRADMSWFGGFIQPWSGPVMPSGRTGARSRRHDRTHTPPARPPEA